MGPQFLDLPRAVRDRIYLEAVRGFSWGCPVDFADNFARKEIAMQQKWRQAVWPNSWRKRANPRASYTDLQRALSLMQVSQLVSEEVAAVFYSCNIFFIRYQQLGDLQPLLALRPVNIRHLRRLRVHLNVESCHWGKVCSDSISGFERKRQNDPSVLERCPYLPSFFDSSLSIRNEHGRNVVEESTAVVQHRAPYIGNGTLDLAIVCDCADEETARHIVAATHPMPKLASCHLRLARHSVPDIQFLAQAAAVAATGIPQPPNKFPFFRLPPELRAHIFTSSDVITPHKQVVWEPKRGYSLQWRVLHCFDNYRYPQQLPNEVCGSGHHACRFRQCHPWASRSTPGCFCRRYHSAFSTHPDSCRCWQPPGYLFLVGRKFSDEARESFFSGNRFIIVREGGFDFPDRSAASWYPVIDFVSTAVPRHHLKHLRTLELVFHPFDEYDPDIDPAFQEWTRFLDATIALNFSGLTVHVCFADYTYDATRVSEARFSFSERHKVALQDSIVIMQPMRAWALRGLQRIFVWMPDFMLRTPRVRKLDEYDGRPAAETPGMGKWAPIYMDRTHLANAKVERAIMGPEYDSMVVGKADVELSAWVSWQFNQRVGEYDL